MLIVTILLINRDPFCYSQCSFIFREKNNMKHKRSIIAIIIAIIIIIFGLAIWGLDSHSKNTSSNHTKVKNNSHNKRNKIKKSASSTTSKISSSSSISDSENNSSQASSSSSISSQVNSNLLQISDFGSGFLNNQYAVKAIIYYGVMHGEEHNDQMWTQFKDMVENPSQYGNIQLNLKQTADGLYLTSNTMGGIDVSWPTVMWSWGEKTQNPSGQPDFLYSGQGDSYGVTKQNIVDYINSVGGKKVLDTFNYDTNSTN